MSPYPLCMEGITAGMLWKRFDPTNGKPPGHWRNGALGTRHHMGNPEVASDPFVGRGGLYVRCLWTAVWVQGCPQLLVALMRLFEELRRMLSSQENRAESEEGQKRLLWLTLKGTKGLVRPPHPVQRKNRGRATAAPDWGSPLWGNTHEGKE